MPSLFTINSSVIGILLSKNAKIAENYSFNAAGQTITINEPDFKRLLYVIDKDSERILYTPYKAGSNGKRKTNINLNYDTTDLNNNNELLVIYESLDNNSDKILCSLESIENLLTEQNKILKKIYK